MRKASEWNPREGDLSRDELIRRGNEQVQKGWMVQFKFSCAYCGERCTFDDFNTLYENGECFKCGETTVVDVGGFLMFR